MYVIPLAANASVTEVTIIDRTDSLETILRTEPIIDVATRPKYAIFGNGGFFSTFFL
ncbi:hypothetical protein [Wolbachia endosymbiont of Mansonella perstans]|uniref:hypothetical protein n=1 Tax=Wolbachia endosymbiont of Mansonella perstans TaxID=229526 RepID=UPI001CE0A2FA|nr:hypothetical protein [Wolbachia endosymbiont of Mansonella perstans]MCA4773833.1 hypothetical protein [Wolbachia endosymbiont of Mansonella perstans]